jgi:hypothetical protein
MRRSSRINVAWWKARILEAPGLAIAAIFISVSAMMSVTCGYRFGEPSGNALVFAAVALGAEAFADLSIPLFWRRVGFLGRTLLIVFFAVCLGYKLEAAKRFAAENFGLRDAAIAKAAESYEIALARVEALRKTLTDNANVRPAPVLQAEIDGLLRDPRTEGCTGKTNGPVTTAICPKVDALRGELARAGTRDQAQADLVPALAEWRAAAPATGKAVQESAGPLQMALALAGITVAGWSALMATLVMALVEGGAIVVPMLIGFASGREMLVTEGARVALPAGGQKTTEDDPPGDRRRAEISGDIADLSAFLGDRSTRAPGERVQASTFYGDYKAWKTGRGETPVSVQRFGGVMMRELGIEKRKMGDGKNWYHGLRLNPPEQRKRASRTLRVVNG